MSLDRYAATQNATLSPREVEQRAFRHVNALLASAPEGQARTAALHKTHQLWTILLADLGLSDNALPAELKGRLISLGLWAQREAFARIGDGGSLAPLIELHRDLIAGLEGRSGQVPAPRPASATA